MAEQTQTEKLGNRIDYLLSSALCTSMEYPKGMTWEQLRKQILKACKEAGLKFVKYKGTDEYHPYPIRYDEEIEI